MRKLRFCYICYWIQHCKILNNGGEETCIVLYLWRPLKLLRKYCFVYKQKAFTNILFVTTAS